MAFFCAQNWNLTARYASLHCALRTLGSQRPSTSSGLLSSTGAFRLPYRNCTPFGYFFSATHLKNISKGLAEAPSTRFFTPTPYEFESSSGHKKNGIYRFFLCAQNWTRTSTSIWTHPPQGCVSTNFTIWALIYFSIVKIFRAFANTFLIIRT